jgi:hypothetical protein
MALLDFLTARIPSWESNYCGSPPNSCEAATLRADFQYPAPSQHEDLMASSVRDSAGPSLNGVHVPPSFSTHAQW